VNWQGRNIEERKRSSFEEGANRKPAPFDSSFKKFGQFDAISFSSALLCYRCHCHVSGDDIYRKLLCKRWKKVGKHEKEMENYGMKDHVGDGTHALLSELTRVFRLN